jgi:glycine/D-amino acid oxidase-like deaminating enzyme
MSTAYHLLDLHRKKQYQQHQQSHCPSLHVTIFDRQPVGTGGASAVAGGYVRSVRFLLFRSVLGCWTIS